jgi:hypothetical protein
MYLVTNGGCFNLYYRSKAAAESELSRYSPAAGLKIVPLLVIPDCQKPEQVKKMHRKACGLIGQDINNCECNKPTQKPEQGEAEIDITKIREDLQFLLENHPFDSVLEQVATYAYCALREVEKLKYN